MRSASGIVAALLLSGFWPTSALDARVQSSRSLNCDSAFRSTDDVAALAQRYGTSAVAAGDIHLGEGFDEAGTILGWGPFGKAAGWAVLDQGAFPQSARKRYAGIVRPGAGRIWLEFKKAG